MLSLLPRNDEGETLHPIATLIFSEAGKGKDTNIDTDGTQVYLDADTTAAARIGVNKKQMSVALKDITSKFRAAKRTKRRKVQQNSQLDKLIHREEINQMKATLSSQEINLEEGHAFPMPDVRVTGPNEKKWRQVLYVSAPSNSGKSTFIAKWLRLWIEERKKRKLPTDIVLFSCVKHDNAFTGLGIKQIELNQELLDTPIDMETELHDRMVIFDDIDSISDMKMRTYLQLLRDKIMTAGAHNGIDCINTSHQLTNWKETRSSLKEAHLIVMFPYAERAKINHFLEKTIGLEYNDRMYITQKAAQQSRWVALGVRYPNYVIHEKGLKLLVPSFLEEKTKNNTK